MLCNISQNAMRQRGGGGGGGTRVRYPPGGTRVRYPPRGTRIRYPPGGYPDPPGGYLGQVPPPPGGYRGQVPPQGGTQTPLGGYPDQVPPYRGYPDPPGEGGYPGQVPPPGGTRVGQQKEYSLPGGRYASCVHAGGLSCYHLPMPIGNKKVLHERKRHTACHVVSNPSVVLTGYLPQQGTPSS